MPSVFFEPWVDFSLNSVFFYMRSQYVYAFPRNLKCPKKRYIQTSAVTQTLITQYSNLLKSYQTLCAVELSPAFMAPIL